MQIRKSKLFQSELNSLQKREEYKSTRKDWAISIIALFVVILILLADAGVF